MYLISLAEIIYYLIFYLFYSVSPHDRLRIFISIRRETVLDRDEKLGFFGGRSSGSRYFTLQRDYLVQDGCFAGRFFLFLYGEAPKKSTLFSFPQLGSFPPRCSHGPATPISSIFYSISEDRTTQTL